MKPQTIPPVRTPEEIRADTRQHRLVAWAIYQDNLSSGMQEPAAMKDALVKAIPDGARGCKSRPRELEMWKRHGLWPPPEADDAPPRQTPLDTAAPLEPEQIPPQREDSATDFSAVIHRETPKGCEVPDAEIIRRAKEILMKDVFVAERPTTAKGRESTLKTSMIAARFPNELVAELKSLGGRASHHLEKALRLYLRVVKSE